MAIIVQHAIESRVCSAQYLRCADQRPGFYTSQWQKQEKEALKGKTIFEDQTKKKSLKTQLNANPGQNLSIMSLKYEKSESELCTHFLLPSFMFTFLSLQAEGLDFQDPSPIRSHLNVVSCLCPLPHHCIKCSPQCIPQKHNHEQQDD